MIPSLQQAEADRLLANKLTFSVIALALLLTTIWMQGIFVDDRAQPPEGAN